MDKDSLVELLISMMNAGDFSQLVEKVPYADRFALFMQNHEVDVSNKLLYNSLVEHIFNEEEAEILYAQIKDDEKKKILFFLLKDSTKLSLINQLDFDIYENELVVNSFKNPKVKYDVTNKFVTEKKLTIWGLEKIIESIPMENRLQLFEKILINYNDSVNAEYNLFSFRYCDFIKNIAEKDRLIAIKMCIELNPTEEISFWNIPPLLEVLSVNERKDALLFILNSFEKEYNSMYVGVDKILKLFEGNDFDDVLYMLIDKHVLGISSIPHLYDYFKIETNLYIIDKLIQYGKDSNVVLIDERSIARLLDIISYEEGIRVFEKYALDNPNFIDLRIVSYCSYVKNKYFYLDYLISKINIESFEKSFEIVSRLINNTNAVASGEHEYSNIIDIYVKKYNIDRIHLIELIKRFDYSVLKYIYNKSVQDAINLRDEDFVKFLNIFNQGLLLDSNTINTVCNSFLQRQFRLENQEDYSIFSKFELLLSKKSDDTIIKIADLLLVVNEFVNIDSYLNKYNFSFDQFIYQLVNDDKNAINLLHDMTQEYIMKKRELFVKEKLITTYDEIGLVKKIEKNCYKKKLLECNEKIKLSVLFTTIPTNYLTEEEKKLAEDMELIGRLLDFKKEHKAFKDPSEKKYLRVFESLLNKSYEYVYDENRINVTEDLQYSYFSVKPQVEWLLGIIVECNIAQLTEKVLNDNEVYSSLISFINKYQVLGWEKTFKSLEDKADIEFGEGTVSSIISNFYILKKLSEEQDITLTQYLDYANCYDSLSKTYSYLLGKDNYRAIVANEGKNKASMSKIERLSRISNLVRGMYERSEITTPPIDKDYETSSGKKLNVVLGNSTNMINLSYGERTNSCLRIGGAFNDLFEFCIHDKNGFHVRFSDPDTGKFISRVSGIRNGNTIFFNELRDSENINYSNEEIIEVLNLLSNELIEKTKYEECPVDNVVITYDYAMRDYKDQAVSTELVDYPNAFYGLRFNILFDGDFVILKTTNSEGNLVPYKLGSELAQTYETQRDKVSIIEDEVSAFEKIAQIKILDLVLKGREIDEIVIEEISNIDLCIAGEDWYIYVDTDGNIYQFVVQMSKHKERAISEIKDALEYLKKLTSEREVKKGIGGF